MRAAVFLFALLTSVPVQAWAAPDIFDHPVAASIGEAPRDVARDGGGLRCLSYRDFMAKVLDSGTPTGVVSVGFVPGGGPCSTAPASGQVTVKPQGFGFAGVKGNFVVLEASDPNGASAFQVLDRRTGKPRYSDSFLQTAADDGIGFIADENDTLHLHYTRAINTSCSLPQKREACFAQIARENHLPAPVRMEAQAFETCVAAYRQAKTDLSDPSILTYAVDVEIPATGGPHVISRAAPSCLPMP